VGGRIRIERDGRIGWLVFDHPERRNAISVDMWRDLPQAARELDSDPGVRVVVLRGAGEAAFVSGADISEFEHSRIGEAVAEYERDNAQAVTALARIGKPVLAMIHGFCVGGGVMVSLAADLRYAAADARFAVPAARLGLGYSVAGFEGLMRVVGVAAAKEMLFTARRFDAEEALRIGLVNRVVGKPELEAVVRETAETIADNAPLTLRSVKQIAAELSRPASERDLAAIEAGLRACMQSQDYREGMRAFLEKRRPLFEGR
jgi:enoyl-CoA hydratase/carnithine racemase